MHLALPVLWSVVGSQWSVVRTRLTAQPNAPKPSSLKRVPVGRVMPGEVRG